MTCPWSCACGPTLQALSELLEQLWMERRREVSIISYRPVSSSDLKQERSFFRRSVWTLIFFCNWLYLSVPKPWSIRSKVIKQTRSYWRLHCTVLCTVKIVLLLHFSCDFSLWKFAFPRGQRGYHSAIVTIGRSLWQYERSSGSP